MVDALYHCRTALRCHHSDTIDLFEASDPFLLILQGFILPVNSAAGSRFHIRAQNSTTAKWLK
jgi:hypothetical protein